MTEQTKIVVVHFSKEEKLTLHTQTPETMLEAITNSETGWFRYENVAFKREHVTYAYITTPKVKKVRTKPHGL